MTDFIIHATDGKARTCTLTIGGRKAQTPFFMPVSTKATLKHITFDQLKPVNVQALIMNAFLLSLRPGVDTIRKAGGLHKFSTFDGIIATDSGGFQVLSPTFVHKKNDDGVTFKDPFTGQLQLFRPEDVARIECGLGSDIAMVLDDQPPYSTDKAVIKEAMDRTIAWARRCITEQRSFELAHPESCTNPHQLMFAIGQGGVFVDLREECARELVKLDADGYAVGGLAIGEPPEKMLDAIAAQTSVFPLHKPRYVMGLGSPCDIIDAVMRGADMFDSIFPTQSARRGSVFTSYGLLRITNACYREDFSPVDSLNPHLKHISKSYLHHLLRVEEPTGLQIASLQNIWFMGHLMQQIRDAINAKRMDQFAREFKQLWKRSAIIEE